MGSGLGVLAVRLAARDAPPTVAAVMAATGSFAAISSLLGSPLLGAFLLLEASGLGGPMLGLVLVPGLLAAGLGTLIFLGLDSLTGLGTFTLTIPGLPPFDHLTGADFGYAIAFGLIAPFLGRGITLLARRGPLAGRAAHGAAHRPCSGSRSPAWRSASARRPTSPRRRSSSPGSRRSAGCQRGLRLVGRRAAAARRVQGPRLRAVAQLVPRRPGLPGACSSARPPGSPRRTSPGSTSSPRRRWASARCAP